MPTQCYPDQQGPLNSKTYNSLRHPNPPNAILSDSADRREDPPNQHQRSMFSIEDGRRKMRITYNVKTDLLYLRLDDRKQHVMSKRLSEDIVLDIGKDDKIVGIEILDASKHLNLQELLPVDFEITAASRINLRGKYWKSMS